jgi:hypothetical protein
MSTTPFTEFYSDAEAGPEDVVCCYLQRLFASTPRLVAIFGADGIEFVPMLGIDFRQPPRLQIGYAAAATEDSAPTRTDTREVRIIIRLRHNWESWEPLLAGPPQDDEWPWAKPSLSAVENDILTAVKQAKKLATTINGQSVQLVHDGPTVGPFQDGGMVSDQGGAVLMMHRDCRVSYGVEINHDTGLIGNVAAALAG